VLESSTSTYLLDLRVDWAWATLARLKARVFDAYIASKCPASINSGMGDASSLARTLPSLPMPGGSNIEVVT
jgi:hypothetical protein